MQNKNPVVLRVLTYALGAGVLSGVVLEALVLYVVEDPVLRLRLGLLCVLWIACPIAISAWRPVSPSIGRRQVPTNRRFYLLRRRVDEFLREVKRLNWLVLDAKRDSHTAEVRRDEIGTVKADLHELLGEIIGAAGRPSAKPESEGPLKERFSAAVPAIGDFAPGSEIGLGPDKDEAEEDQPE